MADVEIDEAHREHVVGEEGELVFAVHVVRFEGVPKELNVFLLLRRLEGERWVVIGFYDFCRSGGPFTRAILIAKGRLKVVDESRACNKHKFCQSIINCWGVNTTVADTIFT